MARFIDFYRGLQSIPTHPQDIAYDRFSTRRALLYKDLGIPIHLLSGRTVIEFGPGGAYNARPILDHCPSRYDFVDAMEAKMAVLEGNIERGKTLGVEIEIFENLFDNFRTEKTYDLVIAEACIPGQDNPSKTLENISDCVNENGFIVITNTSKTSLLSEILRSVIGKRLSHETSENSELIDRCVDVFRGHLESLSAETRSIRDWVLDNILHEWHAGKSDFSFPEAYRVLENLGFSYHGGSPSFFRDFLWYKDKKKVLARGKFNLIRQYQDIELLLLDHRISIEMLSQLPNSFSYEETIKQVDEVFDSAKTYLECGEELEFNKLLIKVKNLAFELGENFIQTSKALLDFSIVMEKSQYSMEYPFKEFKSWWGRGQQYNSFQRL